MMLKTKRRYALRLRLRTGKSGRHFAVRAVSGDYRRAAPHPDPKVVRDAEKVFAGMGMTRVEAIALFYRQTVLRGDFPITELIPNEETQAAIRDARAGIGLIRVGSVEEMHADILKDE